MELDAYLLTVHYDKYDSSLIAVAGTLEGAKARALEWYHAHDPNCQEMEWWQPSDDVWQANTPESSVDRLTIEGWRFVEHSGA